MKFTPDEIAAAQRTVYAAMPPTPQYAWPLLGERLGCTLWAKHENHTPVGAFKIRGGLCYIETLAREQPAVRHVISATRGNHGQSIAFAARRHGLATTIVVPHGNSVEKNAAMRALGATLVEHGDDFQAASEHAALKMAAVLKVSPSTVMRHWQANGLKPHLVRGFKVSRDPEFAKKLEDIVGLYMSPPERALVLCCDEKSQVQALDRTQPGLPLKKGRARTMTHDYKRHGTTTLFAALNVLDGQVIGQCQPRHTHAEWLKFLRQIDRETPKDKTLHLIADNYATHKHPAVQAWLTKHPRFNMHFTPTSASWLNMVERFFRDITVNRLRRGVFTSVAELTAAIDEYVAHHNANPKPFIWTKSAGDILQKVIRANSTLRSKKNATLH